MYFLVDIIFRCRLSNGTSLSPPKVDQDDKNTVAETTGRIRTFAHERGNWATFIYIPSKFPISSMKILTCISFSFSVPFSDSIRELQAQMVKSFENDSSMQLNCIESLHISLTRTVVLQHHWIDDFTKSVRESLTDFRKYAGGDFSFKFSCSLTENSFRFNLNLDTVNVYCNDDCTTTFVAIAVPDIYCAPLKSLVEKFNNCLGEYKLPVFYKVSI